MDKKDQKIFLSIVGKYEIEQLVEEICNDKKYYSCDSEEIIRILLKFNSIVPNDRNSDILKLALKAMQDRSSSLYLVEDKVGPSQEYKRSLDIGVDLGY